MTQRTLEDLSKSRPRALVSLGYGKGTTYDLSRQAYVRIRRFVLLPSRNAPRWLLPLEDGPKTRAGFEIYTPYTPAARILKALVVAVIQAGWRGGKRRRVLIASREPLPLEILVTEITGERQPVFALSLGTPGRFRKLTVQVMRTSGEILGYIKLPLAEAAAQRVRHEAEILRRLWSFATLRFQIPKVLYSGEWEDSTILFQSRGPSFPGPVEWTRLHDDFLETLRRLRQVEKPGGVVVEEVAARWRIAASLLDSKWCVLGEEALALARQELGGTMIPCGIMHGDFAPWNTRAENGRLYVFDWEAAAWEAPILWDAFHFQVQVASLLHKKPARELPLSRLPGDRASFMLYLLASVCQLLEEAPRDHAGLLYRQRLISEGISQRKDSRHGTA